MKSLTKKAILLASVVAAAGTFAVCAATVTVNEPTVDAKSVTVPFTADVADTDQITILAYYAPNGTETPSVDNIVYIDQMAKNAATGNQITFSLRDADVDGNYKVLMGGTGVAVAGSNGFTVGGGTTTGYTISGKVGPITSFDDLEGDTAYQITISLYDADFMPIEGKTIIKNASELGLTDKSYVDFSFTDLEPGSYNVVLEKASNCPRIVAVDVVDANVDVGQKELKGVDMDESFDLTANDMTALRTLYKMSENSYGEANWNIHGDADADTMITAADVTNAADTYVNVDSYN